jgi:hypothetical protein
MLDEKRIPMGATDAIDHDHQSSNASMTGNMKEVGLIVEEDPKAEARLTRKLDIRLIPVLGLTYLILFLDRTNIANARIQGLEKGLNMPSTGFNTCLWIFYLPFALSEMPSNYLMSLKGLKVNWFMGSQMFILGRLFLPT